MRGICKMAWAWALFHLHQTREDVGIDLAC